MMVWLHMRVECSAKIAMTVLCDAVAAMALLRDRGLARRIFLDVLTMRHVRELVIKM
jgi:hypothetical protein